MSESLRARTTDRINRLIGDYELTLATSHEMSLDQMRLLQGKIAGLMEAVTMQTEAAKGFD